MKFGIYADQFMQFPVKILGTDEAGLLRVRDLTTNTIGQCSPDLVEEYESEQAAWDVCDDE